jgi:hypothetical protein
MERWRPCTLHNVRVFSSRFDGKQWRYVTEETNIGTG